MTWTKFHAESFYEYLAKHLRGSSQTPGVFSLLQKGTPLNNPAWESLQYSSSKVMVPLTMQQFRIIETILEIIKKQGIYALDQNLIKKTVSKIPRTKSSYHKKTERAFLTP